MEECRILKNEVLKLIQNGYLKELMPEQKGQAEPSQHNKGQILADDGHARKVINTIYGGSRFEESSFIRRSYIRAARESPTLSSEDLNDISFSSEDPRVAHFPHEDALIITLEIANFTMQRLLVDNGSSANIIFWSALEAMGMGQAKLEKSNSTLIRFNGKETRSIGSIKSVSTYNAIFGRPWIHSMKEVSSTLHQKIKFPTLRGVKEIVRDQALARECYFNALKAKGKLEGQHRVSTAKLKLDVLEDLEEILLYIDHLERVVKIGTRMDPQIRSKLLELLKQRQSTFAWSVDDMVGISPEVITHKLEVDPGYPLVKQK